MIAHFWLPYRLAFGIIFSNVVSMRRAWCAGVLALAGVWVLGCKPVRADSSGQMRNWMQQADDPKVIGLKEYAAGNYGEAKIFLERAIEHMPYDNAVRNALIDIYMRSGDSMFASAPVEASYWYKRILTIDPNHPQALLALGRANFVYRDYEAAISALTAAERVAPAALRAPVAERLRTSYLTRGMLRYGYRDYVGARDDYNAALVRIKNDPGVMLELARVDLVERLYREAIAHLRWPLGQPKMAAEANYLTATAYQGLRQWVDSLPYFRSATTEPTLAALAWDGVAQSQFNQASAELRTQQYNLAEPRLVEVSTLRPQWPDGWFYLGQSRIGLRDGVGARDALLTVQKIKPDFNYLRPSLASAYILIGTAEYDRKLLESARENFKLALGYDDTRGDGYYYLANTYRDLRDWGPSVQSYAAAQQRKAFYEDAGVERGRILFNQQRLYRPAMEALEDVEARKQDYRDTRAMLVELYAIVGEQEFQARNWAEAIRLLEKMFVFRAESPNQYRLQLGIAYVESRQYRKALPWLEQGLRREPDHRQFVEYSAKAHVGIADEEYSVSHWPLAVSHYEAARSFKYPDRRIEFNLGDSYAWLKQWEPAATLLRGLQRMPVAAVPTAKVNGRLVSVLGQWADERLPAVPAGALELAREALRTDGRDPLSLWVAGAALYVLRRYDEAIVPLQTLHGVDASYRGHVPLLVENYYLAAVVLSRAAAWPDLATYEKVAQWQAVPKSGPNVAAAALQYLDAAQALAPDEVRVAYARGWLLLARGDAAAARTAFYMSEHGPQRPVARAQLAMLAHRARNFDEALWFWDNQGWDAAVSNPAAYAVAGTSCVEALPRAWTVLAEVPASAYLESALDAVSRARKQADWSSAVLIARRALEMVPDEAEWQWHYGAALVGLGRTDEAMPYLESARASKPDEFRYQYTIAGVELSRGNYTRVFDSMLVFEKDYEAARAYVVDAYLGYSQSLLETETRRAMEYARWAFQRAPERSEVALYAGSVAFRLEEWAEAADFYDVVLRFDGNNGEARYRLAVALARQSETLTMAGKLEDSERLLTRSEQLVATADGSRSRAMLLAAAGDLPQALFVAMTLRRQHPEFREVNALVQGILGRLPASVFADRRYVFTVADGSDYLSAQTNATAAALDILRAQLDESEPALALAMLGWALDHNAEGLETLGTSIPELLIRATEIYVAVRDWQNAQIAVQLAERALPGSAVAQFLAGRLAESQGNNDRAEAAYAKALSLDPTNTVYRAALERVN